jgi:hypothetical protein
MQIRKYDLVYAAIVIHTYLMLKYFLFILSLLLFCESVFSQEKSEKSVRLFVSLMKSLPHPKDVPWGQSFDPDIKLVILNNTDTTATFYQTWNSWGDNAIQLELTTKDSVFTLHYASFCSSNNYPAAEILRPGDSMCVYIKVEKCYERGPCPCLYSMPKGYRFPINNLRGAQLRAFYRMNLENHQQEIHSSLENAKLLDSVGDKSGKIVSEQKKYLRTFVTSELVSKPIEINFDSW